MSGNDLVVGFMHDYDWDGLPPPVQCMARMTWLDGLGATVVGTSTPASRITAEYAVSTDGPAPYPLISSPTGRRRRRG